MRLRKSIDRDFEKFSFPRRGRLIDIFLFSVGPRASQLIDNFFVWVLANPQHSFRLLYYNIDRQKKQQVSLEPKPHKQVMSTYSQQR